MFQCEFEWKWKSGKVKLQTDKCIKYHNRITFTGDYKQHICAMKLNDVKFEDAGKWTCELEEHKYIGRGNKDKRSLLLNVIKPSHENLENHESGSGDRELDGTLEHPEKELSIASVTSSINTDSNMTFSERTILKAEMRNNDTYKTKESTTWIDLTEYKIETAESYNKTNSMRMGGGSREGIVA